MVISNSFDCHEIALNDEKNYDITKERSKFEIKIGNPERHGDSLNNSYVTFEISSEIVIIDDFI
jgi:hypothetical protein